MPRIHVLFVCLGNICRSPMAEAVFQKLVYKKQLNSKFNIDSAGTAGYHIGEPPDERTLIVLHRHNITTDHLGRQLTYSDLDVYDYILAMDMGNYQMLQTLTLEAVQKQKIHLFREYDPLGSGEIIDPYYGDLEDFEELYIVIERCCQHLLDTILISQNLDLHN